MDDVISLRTDRKQGRPTACINCLCCESVKDSETEWHTICILNGKTIERGRKLKEIDEDCPLREKFNGTGD